MAQFFINPGGMYKNKDHIKYIDDYETELIRDEKGKYKKKVTYIGPYIPFNEPISKVRIKFILSDILSLAVCAATGYASLIRHTTGGWLLTVLPLMVSLLPCLYLIMGAVSLPMSGKPMQRDRYMHSIIRCFRSCAAIGILDVMVILSDILYRVSKSDWMFLKGDYIFYACIVSAGLFSVGIIAILRLVQLDERELEIKKKQ